MHRTIMDFPGAKDTFRTSLHVQSGQISFKVILKQAINNRYTFLLTETNIQAI